MNNESDVGKALKKCFKKTFKVKENSKIIKVDITKTVSFSPDFYIPELDVYVEAKGKLWSDRRMTYQAMAKAGKLDKVIFVFYKNTRVPGLKKTALEWAARFGIKAIVSKGMTAVELKNQIKHLLS